MSDKNEVIIAGYVVFTRSIKKGDLYCQNTDMDRSIVFTPAPANAWYSSGYLRFIPSPSFEKPDENETHDDTEQLIKEVLKPQNGLQRLLHNRGLRDRGDGSESWEE